MCVFSIKYQLCIIIIIIIAYNCYILLSLRFDCPRTVIRRFRIQLNREQNKVENIEKRALYLTTAILKHLRFVNLRLRFPRISCTKYNNNNNNIVLVISPVRCTNANLVYE